MRQFAAKGLMVAAALGGGASMALSAPDTCVKGTVTEHQPPGADGDTYGQEYFAYDLKTQDHVLAAAPRQDRQMFLYYPGSGMWIYGDDWCYDAQVNTIRLLRTPPRIYATGGGPGGNIGQGGIVWVYYVPAK